MAYVRKVTYQLTKERDTYLDSLKKKLEKETGRFVSYQEILDHLIDILIDSRNDDH